LAEEGVLASLFRNDIERQNVQYPMPADPDQTVTIVTSRAIRAGREEDFERWVEELNRIACAGPGYRAAIRLGQTAGFQHLLFRFHDQATAEAWQASKSRTAHVAVADSYSTTLCQTKGGATASLSSCPVMRALANGSALSQHG
jgi:hypothetical protein